MEKKNTIVLTIIAIVTLLIAVVGVTYAYFTTQVITKNIGENTATVKTATLASATMDMGNKVTSNNVYPGAKVVKSVNVKGSCGSDATECDPVEAVISVTEDIPDVFGEDVKWVLYKSDTAFACRNVLTSSIGEDGAENQYNMISTCKVGATDEMSDEEFAALVDVEFGNMTKVISSDGDSTNAEINVDGDTDDNYYLVVTYKNNEDDDQNDQQGEGFVISIGFTAKSLNN